jgi:hypothetical protein
LVLFLIFTKTKVPLDVPVHRHVPRYIRSTHEPELEDYYYNSGSIGLRYSFAILIFKLRSFVSITLTLTTLFNVGLSVSGTVLCTVFNLITDLPLSLIATGIIFPISFGISFNFHRRETTIREIAVLKAVALSMYLVVRDWPAPSHELTEAVNSMRDSIGILMTCIRQTMLHNTPTGGAIQVYKAFDDLENRLCEINTIEPSFFRNTSMYSRIQQYLRQMIEVGVTYFVRIFTDC